MSDRFESARSDFNSDQDVELIDETQLVLRGGGSFHSRPEDPDTYGPPSDGPDAETTSKAESIAATFGMKITSSHGSWWGYSEYTPDPGDVSVFNWERAT